MLRSCILVDITKVDQKLSSNEATRHREVLHVVLMPLFIIIGVPVERQEEIWRILDGKIVA